MAHPIQKHISKITVTHWQCGKCNTLHTYPEQALDCCTYTIRRNNYDTLLYISNGQSFFDQGTKATPLAMFDADGYTTFVGEQNGETIQAKAHKSEFDIYYGNVLVYRWNEKTVDPITLKIQEQEEITNA